MSTIRKSDFDPKLPFSEVSEVTSDFRNLRKSLVALQNTTHASLSKERERERERGATHTPPPLLSPSLLSPLPQETAKSTAAVHGLLARWCSLTGNVPDATKGQTAEQMFSNHVDQLAAEKRQVESLTF